MVVQDARTLTQRRLMVVTSAAYFILKRASEIFQFQERLSLSNRFILYYVKQNKINHLSTITYKINWHVQKFRHVCCYIRTQTKLVIRDDCRFLGSNKLSELRKC